MKKKFFVIQLVAHVLNDQYIFAYNAGASIWFFVANHIVIKCHWSL
jgi:hypothetical protein